ncbi:hypothetical protein ABS71_17235 [bacterium SCN 62-11]|nr:MAG: hypothetical protein ABS71_17235 [bacterium SCN 62-11]
MSAFLASLDTLALSLEPLLTEPLFCLEVDLLAEPLRLTELDFFVPLLLEGLMEVLLPMDDIKVKFSLVALY